MLQVGWIKLRVSCALLGEGPGTTLFLDPLSLHFLPVWTNRRQNPPGRDPASRWAISLSLHKEWLIEFPWISCWFLTLPCSPVKNKAACSLPGTSTSSIPKLPPSTAQGEVCGSGTRVTLTSTQLHQPAGRNKLQSFLYRQGAIF